jgi:hypothetical protein
MNRPAMRAPPTNRSVSMKSITATERGNESSNGCATVKTISSAALAAATARRISQRSESP